MPQNQLNPRHLSRVLEAGHQQALHTDLRPQTLIIGLAPEAEVLKTRIAERVEQMFVAGLVEEAKLLFEKYSLTAPGLATSGYAAINNYLRGEVSLAEAKQAFIKEHSSLAKRQKTWFKRNKSIQWLPQQAQTDKSVELITTFLDTLSTQA